ncbi:MAG TPA: hypothetical protein VGZ73_05075 [Bryobacteraceae bacterium]|jgi:hypothetical protein|nr:hypothetical protein [Bryobacteraceae bacterium]
MRYITILFVLLTIASGADRDLAGRYAGEWKSNSAGGGGAIRLSLEPAADGAWKLDVVFTYAGEEVKTITRQVKVDQSKLDASYDFDLMGNTLRSKITGELKGAAFEGKYQTTSVDGATGVDEGTWSAARGK